MTLPLSRNTTYASGDPIHGNDLNMIQDAIIAGQIGASELSLHPFSGEADFANWNTSDGAYIVSAAAASFNIGIPLKVGDRIKSIKVKVYGEAPNTADITAVTLYKLTSAMAQSSLVSGSSANVTAAWQTVTIDPADYVLLTEESLILTIAVNAAGIRLGTISVFYDHP